jgi:hypothetical protein
VFRRILDVFLARAMAGLTAEAFARWHSKANSGPVRALLEARHYIFMADLTGVHPSVARFLGFLA